MRKLYDVVVIGLGAMGSAALYQLSKKSKNVLGIDQFNPPHSLGSTHGETRITRVAIGEGEEFVQFAKRSHEIWDEIHNITGTQLLFRVGGLIMAVPDHIATHGSDDFLGTTIRAAEKFNIPHEILDVDQIRRRFPSFNLTRESGYYEPGAGYVKPELCVQTQLDLARKNGAEVNINEEVIGIGHSATHSEVITSKRSYNAEKLILTVGPWIKNILYRKHSFPFRITRQVLYWFEVNPGFYEEYSRLPIFFWERGRGLEFIYGFPASDGLKVATEQSLKITTPETVNRTVSQDEIDTMYRDHVKDIMPGLGPGCVKTAVCLYTVTPDSKFIIDWHPEWENVLVASPCSGHGFKHSAAIGEALAELAFDGETSFDIDPFGFTRFEI